MAINDCCWLEVFVPMRTTGGEELGEVAVVVDEGMFQAAVGETEVEKKSLGG